jgi:hypothetical protein
MASASRAIAAPAQFTRGSEKATDKTSPKFSSHVGYLIGMIAIDELEFGRRELRDAAAGCQKPRT